MQSRRNFASVGNKSGMYGQDSFDIGRKSLTCVHRESKVFKIHDQTIIASRISTDI